MLSVTGNAQGLTNTGLGMDIRTSPTISGVDTGFQVAFTANTDVLWTYGSYGTANLGQAVVPGTSPGINGLDQGSFNLVDGCFKPNGCFITYNGTSNQLDYTSTIFDQNPGEGLAGPGFVGEFNGGPVTMNATSSPSTTAVSQPGGSC